MRSLELAIAAPSGSPLDLPNIDYAAIFPQLFLIAAALVLLMQSSVIKEKLESSFCAGYTVIVGIVVVSSTLVLWDRVSDAGPKSAFAGAIVYDKFSLFFVIVVGCALVLSALVGNDWLESHGIEGPEYYVLCMFSSVGAMLMAAANDLIVVFIGLEILSIALYVLTAFNRRDERSREAAIKYFVLGSFASAVFLYGIALIYGAIGTTNLSGIATFFSESTLVDDRLLMAGLVLLGAGFAFKVAAVPFHQWTPDVYAGAPPPVVGFMAAVAKAGAFAAFIRVFGSTFYMMKEDWGPAILALAVVTLFVGCTVACVQRDVKRMLAYSSISHAGFIALGLQAGTSSGIGGSLFYLMTYSFIVVGTFAVVSVVDGHEDSNHDVESYRGLSSRHPLLALGFAVLLLGQAGLPLTSGFLAKFYVISALVDDGAYAVAVFAMLAAAVAAFFYLRLVVTMYADRHAEVANADEVAGEMTALTSDEGPVRPVGETASGDRVSGEIASGVAVESGAPDSAVITTHAPVVALPTMTAVAVGVSAVFTVVIGVIPQDLFDLIGLARQATDGLF